MRNFFQKNKGDGMERKTVTFTVIVSIANDTENVWQKDIRKVRKILKEQIGSIPAVKVLKIDTKEG